MSKSPLNPLQAARAVRCLEDRLTARGLRVTLSSDFTELARLKQSHRDGSLPQPLFDPAATSLNSLNGFWIGVWHADGRLAGKLAFRADNADPNLADWALGWVLGIYLKRGELIIPQTCDPPEHSITRSLSGVCAYQGEVWVAPGFRGNGLLEEISRLGVVLAHIKWQPVAAWALTSETMAKRGLTLRMGFAHSERGFMRWKFVPDAADATEWISIADRSGLQRLLDELAPLEE